jgi:hypothetical protein
MANAVSGGNRANIAASRPGTASRRPRPRSAAWPAHTTAKASQAIAAARSQSGNCVRGALATVRNTAAVASGWAIAGTATGKPPRTITSSPLPVSASSVPKRQTEARRNTASVGPGT